LTSELVPNIAKICWVVVEMDISINREDLQPISQ